jgi:hypothetical protein
MSENETPQVLEPSKPSMLKKIKSTAVSVGIGTVVYGLPAAMFAGSIYASYKITRMQLDTAKLKLEAAKLTQS